MAEEFGDGLKRLVTLQRPVTSLCVLEHHGFWIVIISHEARIRLYLFSQNQVEFSRRVSHEHVQDLQGSRSFVSLFRVQDRAFALDVGGGVYWLCPREDDDADIFETEAAFETVNWCLVSSTTPVLPSCRPLAASPIGDDFFVIAVSKTTISAYRGTKTIPLSDNVESASAISTSAFPGEDFSARWLDRASGQFCFVGLSDGSVVAVSACTSKIFTLYRSVHAVRALQFKTPSLFVLFESGALVTLSPSGETVTFPLPPLLETGILSPCVASDGLRLIVDKVSIPLSGIVALAPASGDRFAVLTANTVWLAHFGRLACADPTLISPQAIHTSSLTAGAIRFRAHAALLAARSLAARPLSWSVNLRVAQLLETRCVLRVRLVLNSAVAGLLAGWILQLDIYGIGGTSSTGKSPLPGPLTPRKPSVIPVIVDLPTDVLFTVHCSLRLKGAPPLVLPSSVLDACHFLLPPSALIPLPPVTTPVTFSLSSPTLPDLLLPSRPLWRVSEASSSPEAVILFGRRLHFSSTDRGISVTGNDPVSLLALKIAALFQAPDLKKEEFLLELIGWIQAVDILRYSSDSSLLLGIMNMVKDVSRYS